MRIRIPSRRRPRLGSASSLSSSRMGGRGLWAVAGIGALAASVIAVPVAGATPPVAPAVLAATDVTQPLVALPRAGSTEHIRYSSTSIRDEPTEMTGTLLLPRSAPPAGGWPLAVWNHMTVGGADSCAPSAARPGHPELPRMNSGDTIVSALLDAGFAVARPDFEGLGGPGPHPYLIGKSLARSAVDMAVAVSRKDSRIGDDVVVAGHSEGAVAALFAGSRPASEWGDLKLRSVAALAPPTRVAATLDALSGVPVAGPAINELMGLAALLGSGAAAADPELEALMHDGGISRRALALLPHIEERCYAELTEFDSFGGLAPTQLLGPRGAEFKAALMDSLDRNDVARLRFPDGLPVRVDSGTFDTVSPQVSVSGLVDTYRRAGTEVTYTNRPTGHPGVATDPVGAAAIAEWLIAHGKR